MPCQEKVVWPRVVGWPCLVKKGMSADINNEQRVMTVLCGENG